MNTIVSSATKISLGVQAITGLLGIYGLTIPLAPKDVILRQVLGLEIIVQIIEFVFYLGFLSILNLNSLTQERYYDWFLSTPVMLFTISLYFFYVNFIEGQDKDKDSIGLLDFAKNNSKQIFGFVILNFLMLLFGFLAERGVMDKMLAFVLGTAALCGSFGIIYENYAKYSEKTRKLFWAMFGIWALYGVAFLCPPVVKNVSYTILDIFAKNFFGIFLYYIITNKAV
jgi:bacteriorhodopsin